jgi:nucleoside-diphosphate-sugar epimerase
VTAFRTLTGLGAERLMASGERIVIAGAGGWLGLATLEALRGLFGRDFAARVVCFGSHARTLCLRGSAKVPQAPLAAMADLPPAPTLVLHFAFLTQEKAKAMSEADYAASNRAISGRVLAALDRIGATGVFVASSGAAHMAYDDGAEASKRLYGRLKLEDETAFADWAAARGAKASIARVFNVSGPYINKVSSYALSSFIGDALAGRPIEIKARRPVVRSYVAISELMGVAFGALTGPNCDPTPFDTAGDAKLEMADIADTVRAVVRPSARIVLPESRDGPPDCYVGDRARYAALLDSQKVSALDFTTQVHDTAAFMARTLDHRPSDLGAKMQGISK